MTGQPGSSAQALADGMAAAVSRLGADLAAAFSPAARVFRDLFPPPPEDRREAVSAMHADYARRQRARRRRKR